MLYGKLEFHVQSMDRETRVDDIVSSAVEGTTRLLNASMYREGHFCSRRFFDDQIWESRAPVEQL
jgi:hypothetical protein